MEVTRGSLVVVLLALTSPGSSLDPGVIRLIPAFGRHLYIHEAVFFSPPGSGSEQESRTLVAVQKLVSAEGFSSSIVRNASEFETPQLRRPMCVVLFLRAETALAFVKEVFSSEIVYSCAWLLMDPPTLSRVRLPIDSDIFVAHSKGEVATIAEVYRVVHNSSEGDYRERDLLVWDRDRGMTEMTRERPQARRSNLSGVVVRFLVVLEEPWIYWDDQNDVTSFHGYIADIANNLVKHTNISFRMEVQSDHKFGLSLPLGNWTGMIGQMVKSQDLIVGGPLSMTRERFGTIDFTVTLYNNRDVMVVRQPLNDHDADSWQRLTSPFRLPVWIAILSCLLASAAVLYVLAGGSRRISDGLLKATGVICGQAAPGCEGPGGREAASRLFVLSLHVTAICLVASFTGQLTASLGIRHVHVPFYGMEGLLQQADVFSLGVLDGSSSHAHFDQSEDLLLLEIYDKMVVGQEMPTSDEEGLRRVCGDKNYAYIIDEQSLRSISKHVACQFLEIPDVYLVNKICLGASKHFHYKRIFNYWFMRWKKHGMLSRLESKNWPSTEEVIPEELISINIEVVAPLLACLGMGVLVSLLIFTLELHYHRIRPTSENSE